MIVYRPLRQMRAIIDGAAAAFGVRVRDVTGRGKDTRLLNARRAAAWAMRRGLNRTYQDIGNQLGGRDHTTVLNAIRRAERMRESDKDFRDVTDALIATACRNGASGGDGETT